MSSTLAFIDAYFLLFLHHLESNAPPIQGAQPMHGSMIDLQRTLPSCELLDLSG